MTQIELNEIAKISDKYRPIGAWSYFFLTILFAIPLIGQICLIVFALSDSNINRRSFARSFFCTFEDVGAFDTELAKFILRSGRNWDIDKEPA